LQDLELMNIHGDKISHTSDYFDTIYDLAIQLIKSGKAYTDDTEQAQVRNLNSQLMYEYRRVNQDARGTRKRNCLCSSRRLDRG